MFFAVVVPDLPSWLAAIARKLYLTLEAACPSATSLVSMCAAVQHPTSAPARRCMALLFAS